MMLDYTSSFRLYDDEQGKINRQGSLSVHVNADPDSMQFIKGAISTISNSIIVLIEDIETGGFNNDK